MAQDAIEKPIKINKHEFNQKASLQEQIKDIHVSHCLNSATIDLEAHQASF